MSSKCYFQSRVNTQGNLLAEVCWCRFFVLTVIRMPKFFSVLFYTNATYIYVLSEKQVKHFISMNELLFLFLEERANKTNVIDTIWADFFRFSSLFTSGFNELDCRVVLLLLFCVTSDYIWCFFIISCYIFSLLSNSSSVRSGVFVDTYEKSKTCDSATCIKPDP